MRTAFALIALLASAAQAAPPPTVEAVIAGAKRATGGAAWDKVQGCHEEGTHGGGAIHYTTRFRLDAYGMRVDGERGGQTRTMGFNGKQAWQSAGPGKTSIASDGPAFSEAILTAYLSINGFFFPDRFPAAIRTLREASEGGRSYDILEVTPSGTRPVEIWFDRDTHLIRRIADPHGTPPTRVDADEYRQMGGFLIATKLTIYGSDGAVADRGEVMSFRCGPTDPAIFDPPKGGR